MRMTQPGSPPILGMGHGTAQINGLRRYLAAAYLYPPAMTGWWADLPYVNGFTGIQNTLLAAAAATTSPCKTSLLALGMKMGRGTAAEHEAHLREIAGTLRAGGNKKMGDAFGADVVAQAQREGMLFSDLEILSGRMDERIQSLAARLSNCGGRVVVRPWPEVGRQSRSTIASRGGFLAAWEYLMQRLRVRGAIEFMLHGPLPGPDWLPLNSPPDIIGASLYSTNKGALREVDELGQLARQFDLPFWIAEAAPAGAEFRPLGTNHPDAALWVDALTLKVDQWGAEAVFVSSDDWKDTGQVDWPDTTIPGSAMEEAWTHFCTTMLPEDLWPFPPEA